MTAADLASFQYSLLDFGSGRKLEQFGSVVLDRYSPSAEGFKAAKPNLWSQAIAKYVRRTETQGDWLDADRLPPTWEVAAGRLKFRLKTTKFGHLGLFPEQFANWKWLTETCQASTQPLRVLNLFAYTGGSSLACALGGAEVAHVDAAANVVKWARTNAELSGMAGAPIRWIAEDARKFVKREIKRGNTYDGVILDPPSYGHGSKGEVWRIGKHLPLLMGYLNELLAEDPKLVLLTCHSPGYEDDTLRQMIEEAFPSISRPQIEAGPLTIADRNGRQLPSGYYASHANVRQNLSMEVIRSLQNAQIKSAVKLRDRRGRMQQGRTIIDGLREIRRALQSSFPIETIFVFPDAISGPESAYFEQVLADYGDIPILHVTREVMEKLAFGQRVEGAVAVAKIPEKKLTDIVLPECPLVVVIEQVEKPGNVGAILRTMDAVGADLLISADGRTDLFNPNAIRASLGTIFSTAVVDATSEEAIAFLKDNQFQIYAARVDGSVPYTTVDMKPATALVLGSEAHGLSDKWHQVGIVNIHLPMQGIADSLNVSTTAAVLLYESLRQRSQA